jgi:hypothetical protein
MIDYFEGSGEGLAYYIAELSKKGYLYGKHYAPHDIAVKELGTGKSRLETAKSLGLKFETTNSGDGSFKSAVPMLSPEDGIQATRIKLGPLMIDKTKCARVVKCLKNYHKEYDEVNKVYRNNPKHDWSSHCADMMRYFSITPDEKPAITTQQTIPAPAYYGDHDINF